MGEGAGTSRKVKVAREGKRASCAAGLWAQNRVNHQIISVTLRVPVPVEITARRRFEPASR